MRLGGLRDKCAEHTDCRGMLPKKSCKIYVLSGVTSIWWLFEVNERTSSILAGVYLSTCLLAVVHTWPVQWSVPALETLLLNHETR